MRIGELASASGVSTRALRYYEERGLLTADRRRNGYRDYDDAAVARVHNIRTLLDAGLSAENIGALTACLDHDLATTPTCGKPWPCTNNGCAWSANSCAYWPTSKPDFRNNSTSGGNNVAAVTTTW